MKAFIQDLRRKWHNDVINSPSLMYEKSIFSHIQNEHALRTGGG